MKKLWIGEISMMKKLFWVLLVLVVGLLSTGCASGSQTRNCPGSPNSCNVFNGYCGKTGCASFWLLECDC